MWNTNHTISSLSTRVYVDTPGTDVSLQERYHAMLVLNMEKRDMKLVGAEGFEPPTPASQTLCASQAALRPDGSEV